MDPLPAGCLPLLTGKARVPEALRIAETVAEELLRGLGGKDLVLTALASLLLVDALRHWPSFLPTAADRVRRQPLLTRKELVRAIAYMYDRPKGEFQTAELARHVGSSPGRFARLFAASTGKTPVRLYDDILLQAAERILRAGSSTKQTAHQLGFRSSSHFCQFYRRMAGRAPQYPRNA